MNASSKLMRSYIRCSCRHQPQGQPLQSQSLTGRSIRALSTSPRQPYAPHTDLSNETLTSSTYTQTAQSLPSSQPELEDDASNTANPNQDPPSLLYTGTVTRTGTMSKTVQVTRYHQVFDSFLQKHYTRPLRIKVHDPNLASFLREGDIVEYGAYTQAEKDHKQANEQKRYDYSVEKLRKLDSSGKLMRKFMRDEANKKKLQGTKVRGVQFVVRRVVTPFGLGLDQRMEQLANTKQAMKQPRSSEGGQDSLLKGKRGNTSRQSGRASVAG